MNNRNIKAIHTWWQKEKESTDSKIKKVIDNEIESKTARLETIKEFYKKVFASMMDGLRSKYVHISAPQFKANVSIVYNYIDNLIKVKDNKKDVYIKIGNIEFSGEKEQYDEFFSDDNKMHKLINQIIIDAESFFKDSKHDEKFTDLFITD